MFRNYFKIAFRNLRKNKLYSSVNIIGLTIGIASCLLIGIYILHEISFDRFHERSKKIARVTMEYRFDDVLNEDAVTGTKVGPQLLRTFPAIESYVRTYKFPRVVGYNDKLFEEKTFLYADSAFFSMFSFTLLRGEPGSVLNAPDKIVLTESMAAKYFGEEDPIGKNLVVGEGKNFLVTGVAADCPDNSQVQFDFVAAFTSLNAAKQEEWWSANYYTYLLVRNEKQLAPLSKNIDAYMKEVTKELDMGAGNYLTYHLEPLESVHLYSKLDGLEPNGNILYIYVLGIVALLILAIACVNYTNLSTAQSTGRAAEIGVRKVMGAQRLQLFWQFIGESFFFTLIAMLLAWIIAYALLQYFNTLSGKLLDIHDLLQPPILVLLIALGILVSLLAGAYPALLLSNLQIIKVLKSGFRFTSAGSGLRKSLIVFQFVISLFLIISTIIILQQLAFINNKDLGYDKEHIVVLPVDNTMRPSLDAIKQSLKRVPGVLQIGAAYEAPTDIGWVDVITKGEGSASENITVNAIPADEDFVKALGIHIIAGNDFTNADLLQLNTSGNSQNLRYSFILNESAAKALGWEASQAIGQTISKNQPGIIKAVVKDFHFNSFHSPIGPLVIFLDKQSLQHMFVKIKSDNLPSTLKQLETVWKQRLQHRPFEYHFLDEDYDALYKEEQRTAGVFSTFSTLAILLACLGLFALTAFAVVQRTKEIGIRKVLGATLANIFGLLSKDFLVLIVIALIIACPLAWLATSKWLESFTYRINIEWWVFVVAGISTVLIAMLTLSIQAIKAGMTNPVKSLRSE